ncbi:MAG: hypothetical protein V2I36_17045 [Desulfopila sp.]|nr:hypothetical protein [Desulfopila sp.]
MKHAITTGFIVLLVVFLSPSGAMSTESDVVKEVKEAAAAIAEYSVEQKDAAMEKAREMMVKLDAQIDALERKIKEDWGTMRQESKEKYAETLQTLRQQRNELSEWYGSMKYSSKDAWREAKEGFSQSYDRLMRSWKNATTEMDEQI